MGICSSNPDPPPPPTTSGYATSSAAAPSPSHPPPPPLSSQAKQAQRDAIARATQGRVDKAKAKSRPRHFRTNSGLSGYSATTVRDATPAGSTLRSEDEELQQQHNAVEMISIGHSKIQPPDPSSYPPMPRTTDDPPAHRHGNLEKEHPEYFGASTVMTRG